MNKLLLALSGALLMLTATHSHAQISVSVGQPGFYGRIDVGGYPAPRLIYNQPVLVGAVPYGAPPMYVHARPKHIKHWDRHCHYYGACGAPVYFVQDRWYNNVYVPQYRHKHHPHQHHGKHHKHHHKHHGTPHD